MKRRHAGGGAAAVVLVVCCGMAAQASIVGQTNRASVRVGTAYFDDDDRRVEVDARTLYSSTAYTFGGPAVVMDALDPAVRDLLLTASVSDLGTRRTVTVSMTTIDGTAIMDQSVVDPLTRSDYYFLDFDAMLSPQTDADLRPPYSYAYSILGLDGKQSTSTGTTGSPFFVQGVGFHSPSSPAGPGFYSGLTPRGFTIRFEYDIVPAPASAALLACGGLAASRRRRERAV